MSSPAYTYCTPEDVAWAGNFMNAEGDRAVWGTDPVSPSREEVVTIILIAEERLEDLCKIAFGTRALSVSDELHDCWRDSQMMAFHLNFPYVVAFDTNEGDKLEVWQNGQWNDWLALGYTEGRNGDFFVDYQMGKVFFIRRKPPSGRLNIRVSYRVNYSSNVPQNIKYATALLAATIIAGNPAYIVYFPEGEGGESLDTRLARWNRNIIEAIKAYRIDTVPVNQAFRPSRYG